MLESVNSLNSFLQGLTNKVAGLSGVTKSKAVQPIYDKLLKDLRTQHSSLSTAMLEHEAIFPAPTHSILLSPSQVDTGLVAKDAGFQFSDEVLLSALQQKLGTRLKKYKTSAASISSLMAPVGTSANTELTLPVLMKVVSDRVLENKRAISESLEGLAQPKKELKENSLLDTSHVDLEIDDSVSMNSVEPEKQPSDIIGTEALETSHESRSDKDSELKNDSEGDNESDVLIKLLEKIKITQILLAYLERYNSSQAKSFGSQAMKIRDLLGACMATVSNKKKYNDWSCLGACNPLHGALSDLSTDQTISSTRLTDVTGVLCSEIVNTLAEIREVLNDDLEEVTGRLLQSQQTPATAAAIERLEQSMHVPQFEDDDRDSVAFSQAPSYGGESAGSALGSSIISQSDADAQAHSLYVSPLRVQFIQLTAKSCLTLTQTILSKTQALGVNHSDELLSSLFDVEDDHRITEAIGNNITPFAQRTSALVMEAIKKIVQWNAVLFAEGTSEDWQKGVVRSEVVVIREMQTYFSKLLENKDVILPSAMKYIAAQVLAVKDPQPGLPARYPGFNPQPGQEEQYKEKLEFVIRMLRRPPAKTVYCVDPANSMLKGFFEFLEKNKAAIHRQKLKK